jgi:nicotinamide riboside kinase
MKIGLCGTMSVGKTTLVNALKLLPEFENYTTRTERSKELMAMGIPLNTDSTFLGQTVFMAERASELLIDNIITDRTIIDVMAFAQASKSMDWPDKEAFYQYAIRLISQYDYIFYVSPEGVEIEDNGIRETDAEYRDEIDMVIRHILSQQKHRIKNYGVLEGSTEERIEQMLEALSL